MDVGAIYDSALRGPLSGDIVALEALHHSCIVSNLYVLVVSRQVSICGCFRRIFAAFCGD